MIKNKELSFFLAVIISLTYVNFCFAKLIAPITNKEVKALSSKFIESNTSNNKTELLKKHSFKIFSKSNPENFKYFITILKEKNSFNDYSFIIQNQNLTEKEIYLEKSESAISQIFTFEKIEAVSFKNLNDDKELEILIILKYRDSRPVQGEGIGGGEVFLSLIYLSENDKYVINEKCSDSKNIKELENCFKTKP